MQLIAIDDTGAFAALAFAEPDTYAGTTMEITGDRMTAPQIADALGASVGRQIPHTQIPLEALWEHNAEIAKVFTWAYESYYDTDLTPLRKAHTSLMDFSTWLRQSGKARLLTQLDRLPA